MFREVFPYYLSIGMTYEQFYNDDPLLVRAYHKAEKLRTENKNTFEWLQGLYFYEALTVGLSKFSAGLAGKQSKAEYRKEPIRITPKTEKEIKEEKRKALEAYIESLKQFQRDFDRRQKERENGSRS